MNKRIVMNSIEALKMRGQQTTNHVTAVERNSSHLGSRSSYERQKNFQTVTKESPKNG
jgi:hypothetical protein